MHLSPGTRVGHYQVVGPLGQGGMGEVYRAHDSRLGRDVALKILPETFVADPDRVARFEREAKTLASLNNPNIAHVYDAGRADALVFIAMELVDGEDLAARISRGPIPVPEAIAIARQVADGLAAAHEIGVIHRDLKPANIKVRDDGTVKVLDFGLAKAMGPDGGGSSVSAMNSPTLTSRGTEIGVILGTAAYMAPEQARGKVVDRRADLWAFGVVLYEMLTGRRAFDGPEVSDVLASVLKDTPPLDALPQEAPAGVRRLLQRTLEKDRSRRLDSMVAARLELESPADAEHAQRSETARTGLRTWIIAGAAAVTAFALAMFAAPRIWDAGRSASAADLIVSQLGAPRDVLSAFFDGFALSPDGKTLLFSARNAVGVQQVWLRPLDTVTAHPVPGTESGAYPFWAPDGKAFGFFADGKIKRVATDGGQLQTICDAHGSFPSGSWSTRDEIVFGVSNSPLFKVPAAGGSPVALDALGNGYGPVWLADGRRLLFAGGKAADDWGLRLASADGTTSSLLAPLPYSNKPFAFAAGLVFVDRNDALTVQRLDEASGTLVGEARPIASIAGTPKNWFAVTSDGHRVLALVRQAATDTGDPGDPMARLLWVDQQGNAVGTLGDPGHYWTLRLAPDGTRAIVNPDSDIWLLRPEGHHTRLTTGGHDNQSYNAVWSHDGSEIVYSNAGARGLVRQRVDGQSPASPLEAARGYAYDWSPDGRWLLTRVSNSKPGGSLDIYLYDFQTKSSRAWLATSVNESQARFSPDGKWVAYASTENGPSQVFVRPFEGDGRAIEVSTSGGSFPIWRRDGNELYFLDASDGLMAAPLVRSATTITPGKPQRLFHIPLNDITRASMSPYDAAPDGKRFLLNVPDRPTPLMFLQGLETIVGKK